MRTPLGSFITLTLLCAAGTYLVGWWAVPIIAAGWTLALPRPGVILNAAFAAATAWGLLLLVQSQRGPIAEVGTLLSAILGTNTVAIYALTLLYGALLAGSAALVARAINPPRRPSRGM
jgi:hypothetical protein